MTSAQLCLLPWAPRPMFRISRCIAAHLFFAAVGTHAHFQNLATSLAFLAPVATSLFRALQAAGSAAGIAAHLFLLPWAPRPVFIQNHMTVGTNDAGFEFEMLWCFEFDMLWSFASVFDFVSQAICVVHNLLWTVTMEMG